MNNQIKVHAAKSRTRNKHSSTHTWRETFGREVWKRNNFSEASRIQLSLLFNHSYSSVNLPLPGITQSPKVNSECRILYR
jgi:hypothetical protein